MGAGADRIESTGLSAHLALQARNIILAWHLGGASSVPGITQAVAGNSMRWHVQYEGGGGGARAWGKGAGSGHAHQQACSAAFGWTSCNF